MAAPELPRRARLELLTPAEVAIRAAICQVEDLPPDSRLTEAVVNLLMAQDRVADYVDGVPIEEEPDSSIEGDNGL